MPKITIIGAGSVVFTRNLTSDILLVPALQDSVISLMDIDPVRLELARDLVQRMIDERRLPARVEATLDRREAIRGADFVIITIQVGGLEAYKLDIEIPKKYGVGQCVGDTLGPGGVFRGLRTIPILLDIAREMDELCRPEALLINYSNPMSINCWAFAEGSGRPHVGLCHSVQGTTEMLARWIGAPYEEVTYKVAGINHQAWVLEFKWRGEDAYPLIRKAAEDPERQGEEPVRIELMQQFGYFVTESSGHASEYVPYFRKSEKMINEELSPRFKSEADHWFRWGRTGGYYDHCVSRLGTYLDEVKEQIAGKRPLPTERTHEYGSYIIEAMVTNQPTVIHGNVPNTGLITNLPEGCCVEVPCLVDGNGIRPCHVGDLPAQLAALNRCMINVQELAVQGALTGDREAIVHAVMLDPLTAAVCTLPQIRAMVDEMFEAQQEWLPQFR
ncbi:MAG TPA: alpha-glucosidase/alpha-galactosidase [Caldilineae bacterium]|nr:alpha-glucosidase/alpha-galactosidase [Caldilineae bacterium]